MGLLCAIVSRLFQDPRPPLMVIEDPDNLGYWIDRRGIVPPEITVPDTFPVEWTW